MGLLHSYQRQIKSWVGSLTYSAGQSMITPQFARSTTILGSSMSAPASRSRREITAMLRAWGDGEQAASDELVRAVYGELRRQARYQLRRERPNHTLDTTALINEAYIKLIEQRSVKWQHRGHFFALAAELMRRILVDHAKARHRKKRGGANEDVALEDALPVIDLAAHDAPDVDLIALDQALSRLAGIDPQQVKIVELRYFAGFDIHET